MQIKDLIPNSIFCVIGYCNEKHLEILEQYIEQNRFLLNKFKEILVVYNGDRKFWEKSLNIWNECLETEVRHSSLLKLNRGHTFGTMDLDNKCIELSKENFYEYQYIFKSTIDIIFFPEFLQKEIPEADFYYLNGIGYGGMQRYGFDYNRIIKEDFFPQTNFYIIKNEIDYLNNPKEIDEGYELQKQNPNKKPWELKQGLESETFLKRCVERNNLTKHHLMSELGYRNLLSVIEKYTIHDSSHKNLIIDDVGICHLHYSNGVAHSISNLNNHV